MRRAGLAVLSVMLVVSTSAAGAAHAAEPEPPRTIGFASSPTGYPADSCTQDWGPAHLVADDVNAGQVITGTATMAGAGSNDYRFELAFVGNDYQRLEELAYVGYNRVNQTYSVQTVDLTAPADGKIVGCRSSSVGEDGLADPGGVFNGVISSGTELSAVPVATVSGDTVTMTATAVKGGADQFNWTIRAADGSTADTTSGATAQSRGLAPGNYDVGLSVCRVHTPPFACSTRTVYVPIVIAGELAFAADKIPGFPLSRQLSVIGITEPGHTYTWQVDGHTIGTGTTVRWDAAKVGSYDVALVVTHDGASRTEHRRIAVGIIVATRTSADGKVTARIADATLPCDETRTLLTVTSTRGIWGALTTSTDLVRVPAPGAIAQYNLLPPGGVATWTGGCFDKIGQTFRVTAAFTDDRALAATAFSGFLSTVTGGQIDAGAIGKALSRWDNISAEQMPESKAAVAELTKVLRGKGDLGRATGHIWKALTIEPEAGRLRTLILDTGAAFPSLGDWITIAEEVVKAGQAGWDPYNLGGKLTTQTIEQRKRDAERRAADQQGVVDRLADEVTEKQTHVLDLRQQLETATTQRTDAQALLAKLNCAPGLPPNSPCPKQRRQLEGEIQRLTGKITQLETKALPPAVERLATVTAKHTKAADVLRLFTRALDLLGKALSLLNQAAGIDELAKLVKADQRNSFAVFTARQA